MVELRIKLYRDGDKICALMGEDVQEGIAGFGDTPYSALHDFVNELRERECFRED